MSIDTANTTTERDALVALSQVTHIGPVRLGRLRDHFGMLSAAWTATEADLRAVLDERTCRAVLTARQRIAPDQVTARIASAGIEFATVLDEVDRQAGHDDGGKQAPGPRGHGDRQHRSSKDA